MLTKSDTPNMIIIELFPEYKISKLKISLNFPSFSIRRGHFIFKIVSSLWGRNCVPLIE